MGMEMSYIDNIRHITRSIRIGWWGRHIDEHWCGLLLRHLDDVGSG